jgi:hypothetical protein
MEHMEDLVFNEGVDGTRKAINFLRDLRDMLVGHSNSKVTATVKWDGAPAIFAGIDPRDGKFFVAKKGIFNKEPKVYKTQADINADLSGELADKFSIALQEFSKLGIKKGVYQGDLMFTKGDVKLEEIEGQKYYTFHPNTIVYAVPVRSDLGNTIKNAKIGVVWHTTYTGKTMPDMKASFGADIRRLRPSKAVWYRDAEFVDASGTATFTASETAALTDILSQAGSLFRTISPRTLNMIATNDTYKVQIKAWNNLKVREGTEITNTSEHVAGLIRSIEDKLNRNILDAKKADTKQKRQMEKNIVMTFYKQNKNELKKIFDLQNLLVKAKNMVVRKLQTVKDVGTFLRTDKGFKITAPEGFVAIDRLKGNAVKLVDRLEFSQANFNAAKAWDK